MIETRENNVLAVKSGIIVHGCNCQGVMGGGIAIQVRKFFPKAYDVYIKVHHGEGLKLGGITYAVVGRDLDIPSHPATKIIVNANTQDDFGTYQRQVNYEAVAQCFEKVKDLAHQFIDPVIPDRKLDILFPMIGAGLGGGNWKIISTIIDETIPDHLGFKKILYLYKP